MYDEITKLQVIQHFVDSTSECFSYAISGIIDQSVDNYYWMFVCLITENKTWKKFICYKAPSRGKTCKLPDFMLFEELNFQLQEY